MDDLYLEDSYLREIQATVLAVTGGRFLTLDRSIFYPQSGGQPHDTGVLIKADVHYPVVFAGKFEGKVRHEVSRTGLVEGDKVIAQIDWERRYKLMRMHTAAHIISSFFYTETGALITGTQLGTGTSRIDFSLDDFERDKIAFLIGKANEIVQKDIPVKTYTLPREEALMIPGIVKLANATPPSVKYLRIVEIGNIDRQADAGTHVMSTKEVGKIEFLKAENKGKNNRRLYYSISQ